MTSGRLEGDTEVVGGVRPETTTRPQTCTHLLLESVMRDVARRHLADLRRGLLTLHKTLLDWERAGYERQHGRQAPGEWLRIVMADPQLAWLRPLSELIVRIDLLLDADEDDAGHDLVSVLAQARELVVPDEGGSPYARRYHTALQEHPDAVFAHRDVTASLKQQGLRETLH
jgi:hypothetical protein